MNRRALKKKILDLLENDKWDDIRDALQSMESRDVVHHLFTAICSINEECKWNAVRSFGFVVPRIAAGSFESARIVMRRFLWSLNDESGGIGWGAPESMAEIMANDSNLYKEYIHMLISYMRGDGPELHQDGNYLELPALQQGLLWGIARLLKCQRESMLQKGIEADLEQYMMSTDNIVQGHAALCASMCRNKDLIHSLRPLLENSFSFKLYWDNSLADARVCDLAAAAVKALGENAADAICRNH